MKKSNLQLPEIKLVGITVRTKNSDEMIPDKAKIGFMIDNYFSNQLYEKIPNRVNPGITYSAYTEYESDEHGEYTYFIGEKVNSVDHIDPTFRSIIIPLSDYAKFECGPGQMPMVCIDAWQEIWQMREQDFGGPRSYITDFEIYDERAKDPNNTILDIYIGIKKS